jgi:hypothetical protein
MRIRCKQFFRTIVPSTVLGVIFIGAVFVILACHFRCDDHTVSSHGDPFTQTEWLVVIQNEKIEEADEMYGPPPDVETCTLDLFVQPDEANRATMTRDKERTVSLFLKLMTLVDFEAGFYFPYNHMPNGTAPRNFP